MRSQADKCSIAWRNSPKRWEHATNIIDKIEGAMARNEAELQIASESIKAHRTLGVTNAAEVAQSKKLKDYTRIQKQAIKQYKAEMELVKLKYAKMELKVKGLR